MNYPFNTYSRCNIYHNVFVSFWQKQRWVKERFVGDGHINVSHCIGLIISPAFYVFKLVLPDRLRHAHHTRTFTVRGLPSLFVCLPQFLLCSSLLWLFFCWLSKRLFLAVMFARCLSVSHSISVSVCSLRCWQASVSIMDVIRLPVLKPDRGSTVAFWIGHWKKTNHSALSFIIRAFPSGRSIYFLAGKIQLEPTSDGSWFNSSAGWLRLDICARRKNMNI